MVNLNGKRIRNDLQQITQDLKLKASRLKVFRNWKYDNWIKIYSADPDSYQNLEVRSFQFFKGKSESEKERFDGYLNTIRWL